MGKKLKAKEIPFLLIVMIIFITVAGKYHRYWIKDVYKQVSNTISSLRTQKKSETIVNCPQTQVLVKTSNGNLCRDYADPSQWLEIFDKYPADAEGKESIYNFLNEGDIKSADLILQGVIPIDRYEPTKMQFPPTWEEDPYESVYWKFIFYSLRPTRHLLYAWEQTGDSKYKDKLLDYINSYVSDGINKPNSWKDNHAVAFRTMVLMNTWWKLREKNALPIDTSNRILQALEKHGEFLEDRNHYEPQHNHGLNEATALLLLAENFPDMPESAKWLEISKTRISDGVDSLIDADGALIENSPYYHFYTLEKYWNIHKYAEKYGIKISDKFESKLQQMINYATYVLEPNGSVPLIGASLDRKIYLKGAYEEIAEKNPELLYVLTRGKEGSMPKQRNILFKNTGQAILRSGWEKGDKFTDQTQVIFDVGAYRTRHSDYDALSFTLYGSGTTLMPDAGLYTYTDNALKEYFHGTLSHNTVTVDGKTQKPGSASIGEFVEGEDFSYQAGEHELYDGVAYKRAIALLGKNIVVVIDQLESNDQHSYEQRFHLFPEANVTNNNLEVDAKGSGSQQLRIYQVKTDGVSINRFNGQNNPPAGLCSKQYEKLIPCEEVVYSQKGNNAEFVSIIEIGKHDNNLVYNLKDGGKSLKVQTSDKSFSIDISQTKKVASSVEVQNKPDVKYESKKIIDTLSGVGIWRKLEGKSYSGSIQIVSKDENSSEKRIQLVSPKDGNYVAIEKDVNLDLSNKNISLEMKMSNRDYVKNVEIQFSTNNWKGYATMDLKNSYRNEYEGQWISVSLGKGKYRNTGGQWRIYGEGFAWADIDKIRFRLDSNYGKSTYLTLGNLAASTEQNEGSVVLVFDDGYASIMPAVDLMNKYGLKGNIAVISGYVEENQKGYLTLNELERIQNEYGWNLVNHSRRHKPALDLYFKDGLLDKQGLLDDILYGAKFLENNGLNSAPNWYIYPSGSTNELVEEAVGQYYTFGRTTRGQPEVYPFGDPLNVKTFAVANDTKPEDVEHAILDAKRYKLTLFLTFHRIQASSYDRPGYNIDNFEKIIKYINSQSIKVKTLSELDRDNGIGQAKFVFHDGSPEQLSLTIKKKNVTIVDKFLKIFNH